MSIHIEGGLQRAKELWADPTSYNLRDIEAFELVLLALKEERAYSARLLKAIEREAWNAEYDAGGRSEHYDEALVNQLRADRDKLADALLAARPYVYAAMQESDGPESQAAALVLGEIDTATGATA